MFKLSIAEKVLKMGDKRATQASGGSVPKKKIRLAAQEGGGADKKPICSQCLDSDASHFSSKQNKLGQTAMCRVCVKLAEQKWVHTARNAALERRQKLKDKLSTLDPFIVDIPPSNVIWVQHMKSLVQAEGLLRACFICGIDTESRPSFRKGRPNNPTALVQIAVRISAVSDDIWTEHVLLLDMNALSCSTECSAKVYDMLSALFVNSQVYKIGLGLKEDIANLFSSSFGKLPIVHSVLDISDLHTKVRGRESNTRKEKNSLQRLVMMNLNMNLLKPKRITMSNWDYRPLSQEQRSYAICDAIVLLRLFDALRTFYEKALPAREDSALHQVNDPGRNLSNSHKQSQPTMPSYEKIVYSVISDFVSEQ